MLLDLIILELEALARKAEYTVEKLGSAKVQPTKEQYHAFESLSLRFSEVVAKFSEVTDHFKDVHTEWVLGEGKGLKNRADLAHADLIATGIPKNLATFRRNFALIFEGPKDSALDSSTIKSRNKQTRARCGRIRSLSPSAIIVWAAAFPPTLWVAGCMNDYAFDNLAEDMESTQTQAWPAKIREVLRTFGAEEPLQRSSNYREFIRGQYLLEQVELAGDADEWIDLDKLPILSNNPPRPIKRRRIEHEFAAADSQCHDQHGSINSTCVPESSSVIAEVVSNHKIQQDIETEAHTRDRSSTGGPETERTPTAQTSRRK
jgi:hypothetical protein